MTNSMCMVTNSMCTMTNSMCMMTSSMCMMTSLCRQAPSIATDASAAYLVTHSCYVIAAQHLASFRETKYLHMAGHPQFAGASKHSGASQYMYMALRCPCKTVNVLNHGLDQNAKKACLRFSKTGQIPRVIFEQSWHAAGEKIAVEVDGPHHFTANGKTPLGEMRARHRLLDVRGWSTLSVPYFVWNTHSDDAAHIAFLWQVCVLHD